MASPKLTGFGIWMFRMSLLLIAGTALWLLLDLAHDEVWHQVPALGWFDCVTATLLLWLIRVGLTPHRFNGKGEV